MILPAIGLTTAVHLLIISAASLKRPMRAVKGILPYIILVATFGVTTVAGAATISHAAANGHVYFLKSKFSTCTPLEQTPSEQKVVLRVDDIQSGAFQDVQIRMLEDAFARNIPLLLGIIPKDIEDSKRLYYYLKDHSCKLEFAVHGWDHHKIGGYPEFKQLTPEEAYRKLIDGKRVLEKISGKPVTTFIPPNNQHSPGTLTAAAAAGITAVSSEGEKIFDYDVSTYNFDRGALIRNSEVISKCRRHIADDSQCIIMLHPQDYIGDDGNIDEGLYSTYLDLLDTLRASGVEFTTLNALAENQPSISSHYDR